MTSMEGEEEKFDIKWFVGRLSDLVNALEKGENIFVDNVCQEGYVNSCKTFSAMQVFRGAKDIIPYMHSTIGCVFCVNMMAWITSGARAGRNMYRTAVLEEPDVVFGGEKKLKKGILEIDKKYSPKAIAILTTCTPKITGDDVNLVVQELQDEVKAKLITVSADGFTSKNTGSGIIEALVSLTDLMEPMDVKENTVNIIGERSAFRMPGITTDSEECERLLNELGIKVNSVLWGVYSYEDVLKFPQAQLNVPINPLAYEFCKRMDEKFKTPYLKTLAPIGIDATREWLLKVAEYFNVTEKAEKILDEEENRIKSLYRSFKSKLRGKKVVVASDGFKGFAHSRLYCELGMNLKLLALGDVHIELLDMMKKILEYGQDPEVITELNSIDTDALLRRIKPDLYITDVNEITLPTQYQIPYVNVLLASILNPLEVGFAGAMDIAATLSGAINKPPYPKWSALAQRLISYPYSREYAEKSILARKELSLELMDELTKEGS